MVYKLSPAGPGFSTLSYSLNFTPRWFLKWNLGKYQSTCILAVSTQILVKIRNFVFIFIASHFLENFAMILSKFREKTRVDINILGGSKGAKNHLDRSLLVKTKTKDKNVWKILTFSRSSRSEFYKNSVMENWQCKNWEF